MASLALTLAGAALSAASCTMGDSASPASPAVDASSSSVGNFTAESPASYVAKVKNILVALPPTDDEIRAVEADPKALAGLIDGWMKLPQYEEKMRVFFELAFQQTQVSIADFADQTFPHPADINGSTVPNLTQNLRESFARTVLELSKEGRPLTEAMTTTRFMMTPALMELYGFLDAWQVDDAGKVTDRFAVENPSQTITIEAKDGPIPLTDSVDPKSANYMHFYNPDVATVYANDPVGCQNDPVVYPSSGVTLHFALYGSFLTRKNPGDGVSCGQHGGSALGTMITGTDFTDWKMVTIRPPKQGEKPTAFYDLPSLRTATELVTNTPRVGFFTTPAFFANWQTNISNQMRVTINQTLIVALGAAIDGSDATVPPSTPGLDSTHAANPECVYCHRTLDPTRSILASTYSWNYHQQTETKFAQQKGLFAFQGVTKDVGSAADLGATLAAHPLFAPAWAQKLCYYANSSACETDDPEFMRVVSVFQSSGYSWNALVKELLSSPLTTNASPTKTTVDNGEVIAVSRRDHLCAALDARLGFADVCGLDAQTKQQAQGVIPQIVSGLPSDGYGRGGTAPVLPDQPTLFYRAGTENICALVAAQVIDTAKPQSGVKQWTSADPDTAIADFVHVVMALAPSDKRAAPAIALLRAHFDAAKQQGASASDALKSTFVTACLAPSSVAIGL